MAAPTTETTLQIQRTYKAPPEKVFAAWTDAKTLTRWFAPSDQFEVVVHEVDPRVGGRYRIEMRSPEGRSHIALGTYKEIAPPERLVFTWNWEGESLDTVVTIELIPEGDHTRLVLTHERFSDSKQRDDHNKGWIGCLEMLSRVL